MTDLDALIEKINSLTDPAISTAVEATRVEAYADLAHNLTGLLLVVGLAFGAIVAWKRIPEDLFDGPAREWACGVLIAVAVIVSIFSIGGLLDPWLYVAMAHPELYLAKSLLKIGG